MYTKPVKDPTLLNLFVPDINSQVESKNTKEDYVILDTNIDNSTTALTIRREYSILDPQLLYTVKKSIKLSIRSFLISLSLTFLNLFI